MLVGGAVAPRSAATAAASPAAQVKVTVNGIAQPVIALDCSAITCDVPADSAYPNQGTFNPTGVIATPASLSAAELVTLSGCDPTKVQKVEINHGGTPDVTLTPTQVNPPTSFLQNLEAIFYDNGSGVATFRRPLTAPAELNSQFTVQQGAMLRVAISTPPCMKVSASVDHTTVTAGKPVTFTVTTGAAKPGESLTARWDFRDGTTKTEALTPNGAGQTAAQMHSYAGAGTYSGVTVTVRGSLGSGGSATTPTITVGRAPGKKGTHTDHPNHHKQSTSGSPSADHTNPTGSNHAPTDPAHTKPKPIHPTTPTPGAPISGVLLAATPVVTRTSAAQGESGAQPSASTTSLAEPAGLAGALALIGLGAVLEQRPRAWRRRRLA